MFRIPCTPRKTIQCCTAICVLTVVAMVGCRTDRTTARLNDPIARQYTQADDASSRGVQLSIADAHEVDIVESLVSNRNDYRQRLEQLHAFYESRGHLRKAGWAAFELKGLGGVQKFRYILDVDVTSDTLRPADLIPEAETMFSDAKDLMRQGGHGIPALYRQDRMVEAANMFRDMIKRFPTSEKIDDAAFFLGEIHKEYMPNQEEIAVRWYERAWTWDTFTPHPARFQAAVLYDYRLHDRDRALELYHAVLKFETATKSNVRFASRRIHELSGGDLSARATAHP